VLIEKYLVNPRHVEIQVFADKAGNTVYLFERDCSIQRRHQKVLEEAPAPGLSEATREKMGNAAVAAAKAIGYVGAGTVEFLLDAKENFYFMEMNTRLQVEHPVTEYITGLDLVELQVRVAEGQKLPFAQKDLKINGHAMEVRLYAEDPSNNFLPGAGQIKFLHFPDDGEDVRVDTGVREAPFGKGDVISIHYDPMIAKIIAHGKDRAGCIESLKQALERTMVAGPKTNIVFLRRLLDEADFKAGKVSTSFIRDHEKTLLPAKKPPTELSLALAALGLYVRREFRPWVPREAYDNSPWRDISNWRIGGAERESYTFTYGDTKHTVSLSCNKGYLEPIVHLPNGKALEAHIMPMPYDLTFHVKLDGASYNPLLLHEGRHLTLMYGAIHEDLHYLDPLAFESDDDEGDGRLHAPMPGKVVAVRVELGAKVKKGQPLIIVEAMKMEHTIIAPNDGEVASIHARVGDQVDEKLELIAFK
jgi:3-methylcrotonyl-CoA carboxylase alpha subunit